MSKVLRLRSRAWRPISLAVIGLAAAAAAPASASGRPGTDLVKAAAKRCAALTGTEVPARQFALPTRGAHIDSGTLTAADTANGRPEFCLVRGSVRGQDPAATPINFEVNLPTSWNRKAVQFGGGGFNGSLVTGLDPVPGSAPVTASAAPPINRGYATFGSDGGTAVGTNPQGSFALNAETLRNYAGESVKRTHDVAAAILQQYYRRSAAYQYYVGGSKGGHEGLVAAQRYGKDYDGIVAYYPANQNQAMVLSWYHLLQAAYKRPGGYLNPAKQQLLVNAVYQTCDGLDGAQDGVVSNVRSCQDTFDVKTLRCPTGADTGDSCLSDAQIGTLEAADTPFVFDFPLANGVRTLGSFPVYRGADLGGIWLDSAGTGLATAYNGFAQPVIKYFIKQETGVPGTGFDFDYRDYASRVKALSWLYDATDPDVDSFALRGGKLILVQGTTDMLVPDSTTNQYYQRLVARYGLLSRWFVRYYTVPGYGHGNGRFNASWDSLTALEDWAEDGHAPRDQVVYDGSAATRDRSRPLCEYPTFPRYVRGDVNQASSFTCAWR